MALWMYLFSGRTVKLCELHHLVMYHFVQSTNIWYPRPLGLHSKSAFSSKFDPLVSGKLHHLVMYHIVQNTKIWYPRLLGRHSRSAFSSKFDHLVSGKGRINRKLLIHRFFFVCLLAWKMFIESAFSTSVDKLWKWPTFFFECSGIFAPSTPLHKPLPPAVLTGLDSPLHVIDPVHTAYFCLTR